MMTLEKAARAALEALKDFDHDKRMNAITALTAALEQPAQQEPVAKVCHDLEGHIGWNPALQELPDEGTPLYTRPQAREPLTDEPYAYTWESRRLDGSTTRHIVYADHYVDSPGDLAYVLKGHDYIELFKRPHAPEPQEPDQRFTNLLCRIHRDGGHYIAEHGFDKAVAAADIKVAELNSMSDTSPQAHEPLSREQALKIVEAKLTIVG